MRLSILSVLLITGCSVTSPEIKPITATPSASATVIAEELTQRDVEMDIEHMIAERNRLQRQLYSISTYQLDLPVELREAIHCGDLSQDVIFIPNSDYLKIASKIVTQPEQMEELLIGYIKQLIKVINESNEVIITQTERRKVCYDKFKP